MQISGEIAWLVVLIGVCNRAHQLASANRPCRLPAATQPGASYGGGGQNRTADLRVM